MAYKSLITQVQNSGTIEKLVSGTPAQIFVEKIFICIQFHRSQYLVNIVLPFSSFAFGGKDFREFVVTSR